MDKGTLNEKLGRRLRSDHASFRSPSNKFRNAILAAIAVVTVGAVILLVLP